MSLFYVCSYIEQREHEFRIKPGLRILPQFTRAEDVKPAQDMKVDAFLQLHLECKWPDSVLKQANKTDDMHRFF